MKANRIIYLSLLTFFLSACESWSLKTTSITGRAYNMTDNSPLEGFEIHLRQLEIGSEPLSAINSKIIATAICNAEGKFSFNEEISNRSKYEYDVIFDDDGESFMPNSWQFGAYDKVVRQTTINPGKANEVELRLVKTGEFDFHVTNNYSEELSIELMAVGDKFESKEFTGIIGAGESINYGAYSTFPSGSIKLIWQISANGFQDTVEEQITLEHNQVLDHAFAYP